MMKAFPILIALLLSCSSCHARTNRQAAPGIISESNFPGDTVQALGNNLMVIYQDSKNIRWFGSWKDGLYNHDGKTIRHFTTDHGLPHNRIDEIKEDASGNLYFNTSGGVSRFDGQTFTTLNETVNAGAWELNRNDLWFRCMQYPGHVYRYDGKSLHRLKLPETKTAEAFSSRPPNTPSPYNVYCIYKDRNANIWFGTAALGALRYNGSSFDWISEEDVAELHDGPSNGVRSIIEDKDGYFWFNTLYRYRVYDINDEKDLQQGKFYSKEPGIGSLDGRKDGNLHEYLSSLKAGNNDLWFVTYTNGAWRYDGKNIRHYAVQNAGKDITTFCITRDNKDNLWIGTEANGAFRFNGKAFEPFQH